MQRHRRERTGPTPRYEKGDATRIHFGRRPQGPQALLDELQVAADSGDTATIREWWPSLTEAQQDWVIQRQHLFGGTSGENWGG